MNSILKDKVIVNYVKTAMAYGMVRKTLQTHPPRLIRMTSRTYDEYVPMLSTHRTFIVTLGTLATAAYLPYYLFKDSVYLESLVTNKNPALYDIREPEYVIDFILS